MARHFLFGVFVEPVPDVLAVGVCDGMMAPLLAAFFSRTFCNPRVDDSNDYGLRIEIDDRPLGRSTSAVVLAQT